MKCQNGAFIHVKGNRMVVNFNIKREQTLFLFILLLMRRKPQKLKSVLSNKINVGYILQISS